MADTMFNRLAKSPDFWPRLVAELNLTEVEVAAIYPQNERVLRVYIYEKLRLYHWSDFAHLINSDTE